MNKYQWFKIIMLSILYVTCPISGNWSFVSGLIFGGLLVSVSSEIKSKNYYKEKYLNENHKKEEQCN